MTNTNTINKIDFMGYIAVDHANPNGDPLNGNEPRIDANAIGDITDVCIKRKIRNALDRDTDIFVKMADSLNALGYTSLEQRIENDPDLVVDGKVVPKNDFIANVCKKWIDIRAFGQVFAYKSFGGVSVHLTGPVTISDAYSIDPITIESLQITKSVNGTKPKKDDESARSSDTMGMKHRVQFGLYKFVGSIMPRAAAITGLTEDDVAQIKEAMATMFEEDASTARPSGSMWMQQLYWVTHNDAGNTSTAKIHHAVDVHLKDGIEIPTSVNDYVFDDSALMAFSNLLVDKCIK